MSERMPAEKEFISFMDRLTALAVVEAPRPGGAESSNKANWLLARIHDVVVDYDEKFGIDE